MRIHVLAGILVAGALAGCASVPDGGEDVGRVSSALDGGVGRTTLADYTDSSGTIHVRIYACPFDAVTPGHHDVSCSVDSDYAAVGGGATYSPAVSFSDAGHLTEGAFISASYPSTDGASWKVSYKDHLYSYSYAASAYVVGLKLNGISNLRSMLRYSFGSAASPSHLSEATARRFPGDMVMVGGGAYVNYTGAGQMLVVTQPVADASGWFARSKDHSISDPEIVNAVTVNLPRCPSGFGGCLEASVVGFVDTGINGTGFGVRQSSTFLRAPAGGLNFVGTSVGGAAGYSSWGRLLQVIAPSYQFGDAGPYVGVLSKDHDVADFSPSVGASQLLLRRL